MWPVSGFPILLGRKTHNVAPIPTDGGIKLQYLIPHIFHGRVPYNVLDLKYGLKPQPTTPINHEIAEGVLQQTQQIINRSQQTKPTFVINDITTERHQHTHW